MLKLFFFRRALQRERRSVTARNDLRERVEIAGTDKLLVRRRSVAVFLRRELLLQIELREDRFGIEPEITAKVARRGWRVYEVPISYRGRTYAEGKKIGWKDGLRGIWCVIRYNLFD